MSLEVVLEGERHPGRIWANLQERHVVSEFNLMNIRLSASRALTTVMFCLSRNQAPRAGQPWGSRERAPL